MTTLIPTIRNMLTALSGMIDKAAAHDAASTMMDGRIAEDMLPFATQIRMIANFPRQAISTLSPTQLVSNEDDPASLEEAKARVQETLEMLSSVEESTFQSDDTMVDLELPNGMKFRLSVSDYVRDWVFPNFYFHTSIAYAIMRHKGVELGKADLVPHMIQHANMGG